EESRLLAADLATQQQVHVEHETVPLEGRAIDFRYPPHALPDDARRVIHRPGLGQPLPRVEVEAKERHDGLADRQAAARQDHEDPLPFLGEAVHLATDVHLIEAGVGPGVGGHHETFVGHDTQTVSHRPSWGKKWMATSYTDRGRARRTSPWP